MIVSVLFAVVLLLLFISVFAPTNWAWRYHANGLLVFLALILLGIAVFGKELSK